MPSEISRFWLHSEIIDCGYIDYKGIPIGNLTSQLFANLYLNELDYFVKHMLRQRYYIRYMDDFLILGDDKRELHEILCKIEKFLKIHLKLKFNKKTRVFPIKQGVDFCGYKIWASHRLIRKRSIIKIKRKLRDYLKLKKEGRENKKEMKQSWASWKAHCRHANSYNLRKKIATDFREKHSSLKNTNYEPPL